MVAVGGGLTVVGAGWRAEPSGHVAAYPDFSLHESRDVLTFSKGQVTLQTCCGDGPMGSYRRMEDGSWYWSYTATRVTNASVVKGFVVKPGALGMIFIGKENSTDTHSLRRRRFVRLPI